jgi:hypothetical protein
MPEKPDFNKIARVVAEVHANQWDEDGDGNQHRFVSEDSLAEDIAEQLRKVWNARGAADVQAIDAVNQRDGVPELLEVNAIRKLDR